MANKIILLARMTRYEDTRRPTDGITIFYADLDRTKIEVRRIAKTRRAAVDSNAVLIDADRHGELTSRLTASLQ